MNSETENSSGYKLQGAFGDKGTQVNSIGYGHPHADKLIEQAKEVLFEAETGKLFLRVLDHYNVPINVIKGTGEGGFSPEMGTITLQAPGKQSKASGEFILDFAKSIREAELHFIGRKAPNPTEDLIAYSTFIHARNADGLWYNCKIVKELTNSSYFSVLLDSLTKLGFNKVYKAFLEGVSKEELYDYYAEAFDNRGSN